MPDVSSVLKLFRSAARGKEIPEPQGSIAFKVSIDAAAEDDVFEEF